MGTSQSLLALLKPAQHFSAWMDVLLYHSAVDSPCFGAPPAGEVLHHSLCLVWGFSKHFHTLYPTFHTPRPRMGALQFPPALLYCIPQSFPTPSQCFSAGIALPNFNWCSSTWFGAPLFDYTLLTPPCQHSSAWIWPSASSFPASPISSVYTVLSIQCYCFPGSCFLFFIRMYHIVFQIPIQICS